MITNPRTGNSHYLDNTIKMPKGRITDYTPNLTRIPSGVSHASKIGKGKGKGKGKIPMDEISKHISRAHRVSRLSFV
jgi:hypothetical protein